MRIAVAGGTGLIGTKLVARATEVGHDVVVLARSHGVDLVTGSGLPGSLEGCDAVIDASNLTTTSKKKSIEFFSAATEHLVAESSRAGVRHLLTVSIVGCDVVDFGYYYGKRVQEERVGLGDVPWTVLRATQFFEFPEQLLTGRFPVVPVPTMLSQPAAAADVARVVVDRIAEPADGSIVQVAGPHRLRMTDMTRRVAAARNLRRLVLPVSLPGGVGTAMSSGALIPTGEYLTTTGTFEEYLLDVAASD